MSDYFSEELVIMILVRLSAKSLLKCTIVCKSWHSLITSPSFITTHLNAQQNNPTQHLIFRQWQSSETGRYSQKTYSERYWLVVGNKDNTFGGYEKLEFPFQALNPFFIILDSCNGVLCLVDDLIRYTETTILWNPMIRKFVCLPEPSFTFRNAPHRVTLGFGFDPTTNDYKVVRMLYLYPENPDLSNHDNPYMSPPVVELYSLNTGSWKTISPPCCQHVPERHGSQAFVNGAVHWLAKYRIGDEFLFQVLTFSLSNDVFGEMSVPTCLSNQSAVRNMSVTIIGGFLSLVPCGLSSYRTVWVMKEYGAVESWTKLFTINDDLVGPYGRALGIRNHLDSVLLVTMDRKLVFYNYKTCQAIQMGAAGEQTAVYLNSYTESLVLLDKREQNSNNLEE